MVVPSHASSEPHHIIPRSAEASIRCYLTPGVGHTLLPVNWRVDWIDPLCLIKRPPFAADPDRDLLPATSRNPSPRDSRSILVAVTARSYTDPIFCILFEETRCGINPSPDRVQRSDGRSATALHASSMVGLQFDNRLASENIVIPWIQFAPSLVMEF